MCFPSKKLLCSEIQQVFFKATDPSFVRSLVRTFFFLKLKRCCVLSLFLLILHSFSVTFVYCRMLICCSFVCLFVSPLVVYFLLQIALRCQLKYRRSLNVSFSHQPPTVRSSHLKRKFFFNFQLTHGWENSH